MSAANKFCLLALVFATASCGSGAEQPANNSAVNPSADIEVLPPDESVTTPTDELRRGAADPQVDETSRNGS